MFSKHFEYFTIETKDILKIILKISRSTENPLTFLHKAVGTQLIALRNVLIFCQIRQQHLGEEWKLMGKYVDKFWNKIKKVFKRQISTQIPPSVTDSSLSTFNNYPNLSTQNCSLTTLIRLKQPRSRRWNSDSLLYQSFKLVCSPLLTFNKNKEFTDKKHHAAKILTYIECYRRPDEAFLKRW